MRADLGARLGRFRKPFALTVTHISQSMARLGREHAGPWRAPAPANDPGPLRLVGYVKPPSALWGLGTCFGVARSERSDGRGELRATQPSARSLAGNQHLHPRVDTKAYVFGHFRHAHRFALSVPSRLTNLNAVFDRHIRFWDVISALAPPNRRHIAQAQDSAADTRSKRHPVPVLPLHSDDPT